MAPEEGDSTRAGFVGISDPARPVYRIFPLWFFEEVLRLRQLVLVNPSLWEDPYEWLGESIAVSDLRQDAHRQVFLDRVVRPVFAQAWSQTGESDTLLRAYSRVVKDPHFKRNVMPRDEGVRVRSTPHKLLRAMQAWCPTVADETCFVGAVHYLSAGGLTQHLANVVARHGVEHFAEARPRAELLLFKRLQYSHEAEVRLIYVAQHDDADKNLVRVPIDPNELFDDVTFDPRLASFERNEREAVIRSIGYEGPISVSGLYQRTLFEVVIPRNFGELDA